MVKPLKPKHKQKGSGLKQVAPAKPTKETAEAKKRIKRVPPKK